MFEMESVFSENGILSHHIAGFHVRLQQLEMANAIADAIAKRQILVAEAGTGTGKTLAYLVPALLNGGKVIISTGTKTLQDQLFKRDIPNVRAALKIPVTVALLKGRANYICRYHLEKSVQDNRISFATREDIRYLQLIERYANISQTGDKSELSEVPENASIWQMATSTRDNCLGADCPNYKECFVMEARKQALLADVVVVNHHLFFADVMLRDEGLNELLPACNTVIFDEAHQLPETATLFFGESVSTGQLLELTRDTKIEAVEAARDFQALALVNEKFEKNVRDFRLTIQDENVRLSQPMIEKNVSFKQGLDKVLETLLELVKLLENQAERSEGLKNCWQRAADHLHLMQRWRDEQSLQNQIHWIEVYHHALQLNITPLSIADIFQKQLDNHARAWIFTSATLSVKQNFTHFTSEMGLSGAQTAYWESPYNYAEQALLYVPPGLPEPSHAGYIDQVVAAALPVLRASKGRAFFLCTSLRAMQRVYELLQSAEQLDYPLLMQGQGSRSAILEKFRELKNAILIGSQSFWEGIDVRGEALSLVIIDKLPFAPPDDPVLSARIEKINQEGRNAFIEYQLPRAVINLKQGAGRLIRDETDRGVLMICDPRLITKSYGKKVWQSLPSMKRTRDLTEVRNFFEQI